jgi:hypothetical protein
MTEDVHVKIMKDGNLTDLLSLQSCAIDQLHQSGTPRHIIPRTTSYFQTHLHAPHQVIGLLHDDVHCGQAIFRCPRNFTALELGVDTLPTHKDSEKVSILQGLIIHPEYRGRNLVEKIFHEWQSWAQFHDVKHLAARAEASHKASQHHFLKNDFTIIDEITDLYDKARVCVMHKTLP